MLLYFLHAFAILFVSGEKKNGFRTTDAETCSKSTDSLPV